MNPDIDNYDRTTISVEYLNDFYRHHVPNDLSVSGIHRAILEGDIRKVKRWIESGGCVNEKSITYDLSALHLAVIKNDLEILEYLLTRDDIYLDCACSQNKTPLHLAAALGHVKSVEKLIQAGCNVNIAYNDNSPPLHMSVCHPDICHLLIQHGARIDAVNALGRTPLDLAVETDSVETMHMLLYYNADVNIVNTRLTPFTMALLCDRVAAQQTLLEYVNDFNRITYSHAWLGSTLSFALEKNSPLVKDIIERGADVNYGDDPEVDDESCAFSICFRYNVDLLTFKMVWERLRYNDSKNTIDLLDFLNFVNKVPTFLRVIIESDNFEPVIKFFSKGENYFLFVNKFDERQFDLNQLSALTCRMLESGFRANSYDIYAIFSNYGYCELFRILLYMDNDFIRGWLPHMALTRLIFDIDYHLESIVDKVKDISKESILQLLGYSICPSLIDALTLQYSNDESMSAILGGLSRIPSLIELARNAARKHIWQSFKVSNTCQFYTVIDHWDIPTVYKNILTFKRKIYRVK